MNQRPMTYQQRPAVLRFLPRNAGNAAIVGPGHEQIIELFRRLNPGATLFGYSGSQEFVKNHGAGSERSNEALDCIVLLDVVFEDVEIEKVFTQLASFLKEDGTVVLEMLNPSYFENIAVTEGSDSETNLAVIQDLRKKIHHFSKNVMATFERAGFLFDQVYKCESEDAIFEDWEQVFKMQQTEIWRQLKAIFRSKNLIYRLTRRSVPKIRFQSQVLKPTGAVNDVRIYEPLQALASLPGVTATAGRAERIGAFPQTENRIFLWHRPVLSFERDLKNIQALRQAGYLIVTEFDDHYSPWPKIADNKFLSFAGVHAVQTTTPQLAEALRQFNPEIAVFPNQLDYLPERQLEETKSPVRIFFGALNRQDDWQSVMPHINAALKKSKTPFFWDVVFDEAFFDALETDNKRFTPHCPYAVYKSRLLEADISLMPLAANKFNAMKSDLKLVEAAGHGAVSIASEIVYGDIEAHKDISMLCTRSEEYGAALLLLLENRDRRMSMQQAARQYVKKSRLLCHHLEERYSWYSDLIQNRDTLDAALARRLENIVP